MAAAFALKIFGDYVGIVYEQFVMEMLSSSGSEKLVIYNFIKKLIISKI